MKPHFDPRLYLVTDSRFCRSQSLDAMVDAAVRGGVTMVQLREKNLELAAFTERARALLQRLRPLQIPLIINDSVEVALASGADGVHLGAQDLSPRQARRLLGEQALIGLSIEHSDQMWSARDLPVDYVAASPVFPTDTKTDTALALGLEGLKSLKRMTDLPLVGIGGINLGNVEDVIRAGASGVAVVSAILGASDAEQAARSLRIRIDQTLSRRDLYELL